MRCSNGNTCTIGPSSIEHSRETEIGSVYSGVRYIRTFIKTVHIKGKLQTVRYRGHSLYPVFDIAEFDSD